MPRASSDGNNSIGDVTPDDAPSRTVSRRRLSASAESSVRSEIERIMLALDGGDVDAARRAMDALPRIGAEAEGQYLASLLPEPLRTYVLPETLLRTMDAYDDGDLAFAPDLSKISFQLTQRKARRLHQGLINGALSLSGAVITAYPTMEQVEAMAARLAAKSGASLPVEREGLLGMRVTEFLARHFLARGGKIADTEDSLRCWGQLRWPNDPASFPARWDRVGGDMRRLYEALPEQPRLRDILGTASLVFTNTEPVIPPDRRLLDPLGTSPLTQGEDLKFTALMRSGTSFLTPPEYLSLVALSDPRDVTTYPSYHERVAGVFNAYVASAFTPADGLVLAHTDPDDANPRFRVRSAIR